MTVNELFSLPASTCRFLLLDNISFASVAFSNYHLVIKYTYNIFVYYA